ncbi:MAG TPA: DNA-3-methyladenine glycosylase 2 family protein [Clostridia bacterium]|nr:DNA-3-methyladenine glycosylase 2 family protein [Clostridia bacterium]
MRNDDRQLPADPLTAETLLVAVDELAARDADLRAVTERFGPPPLWERPAGFATLVHIVLEQQVSLASAQAAFDRLRAHLDPLTPAAFLELDDPTLLRIGFSRQKARYVRALATALIEKTLDLEAVAHLDDDGVEATLVTVPGIGPWTATIYRLMVLRRPDAWPAGDMALAQSLGEVKGLGRRPSPDEMQLLAEPGRPWRAVAARILWHAYLARRAARGS